MKVSQHNVIQEPLVDRDHIMFPPLHIKLGLTKQYVKSLDKDGDCFRYICSKFPGLSNEKLKAGIFDGPQIRKLMRDNNFQSSMDIVEESAGKSFFQVTESFLGNHRAVNYNEIVNSMLKHFKELGANMSIEVHYLHSHLDNFPDNCGDYSDEQGERFHQDIKTMEERYQGRWDHHMMADYCWSLERDLNVKCKRHSRRATFFTVVKYLYQGTLDIFIFVCF